MAFLHFKIRTLLILTMGCSIALALYFWVYPLGRHPSLTWLYPDIGAAVDDQGSLYLWPDYQTVNLGNTKFRAYVALVQYETSRVPHRYTIAVEYPVEGGSVVCYERNFLLCDLPEDILKKQSDEIVDFNNVTRVVSFDLGHKAYTYKLPSPD